MDLEVIDVFRYSCSTHTSAFAIICVLNISMCVWIFNTWFLEVYVFFLHSRVLLELVFRTFLPLFFYQSIYRQSSVCSNIAIVNANERSGNGYGKQKNRSSSLAVFNFLPSLFDIIRFALFSKSKIRNGSRIAWTVILPLSAQLRLFL